MASTSNSYNFGDTLSEQLIIDAYERIGIYPDVLTPQQINAAQRSANLLLSEWINKGLNLWTIKQSMLTLVPGQSAYVLPTGTSEVLAVATRTSTRNLGGTAFSSEGGVAAYAFDANPATACIQDAPNGYISYNYGNNGKYAINMVGIQSNITRDYTLLFEYSQDNITWKVAGNPPKQTYQIGSNIWFVIPAPASARYYRVRETGGATLNIQEIYFNTILQDTPITRFSPTEYAYTPNKNNMARPSSFWIDRQLTPIMYLWPTPTEQYNDLYYMRISMIQDLGTMQNIADVPQRFFEALCSGLAVKLASKYAPDRMAMLTPYYIDSFNVAAREDADKTPIRVSADFYSGYGRA